MDHTLLEFALDTYHPDAERRCGQQGGLHQQQVAAVPENGHRHGIGAGYAAQAAAHHHQVQRHRTEMETNQRHVASKPVSGLPQIRRKQVAKDAAHGRNAAGRRDDHDHAADIQIEVSAV